MGGQPHINGQPVEMQQSMMLASMGLPLAPGAFYWYDKATGAYGFQGGPTMGIGMPNMLGFAELKPDCSNGTTGVFVNGRHLHLQDVAGLQRTGINTVPGRYWMNVAGQYGYEGSPYPLGQVDLRRAVSPAGGGRYDGTTTSSVVGGRVYATSFGNGDSFFMDSSTGNSWWPGK